MNPESMQIKRFKVSTMLASGAGLLMSACSFTEPARVEADFGNSVRNMISEQIYDPEAAQTPSEDVPLGNGNSQTSGINGYQQAAAEARVERTEQAGSPIPIVGIATGP